ncbi:hypothetical protein SAY86_024824 [Trapa natans]|uniref:Uncharacterized protein n=1 Tax=Trapa natans TaxID=22666 RepID=A0AAN7RBU2_TRANT|nr:hypothetical protein SAY86_024824 [Trapa natans]
MRIRKRKDKLPLSSLSPVPLSSLSLSDPSNSGSRWYLVPPVQLVLRSATTDDIGNNSKPPSDQDASNRTPISLHKTVDQDSAQDLGVKFIGDKKLITSDGSSISTPGRIDAKVQLSSILSRGSKKPRRNQEDSEEEGEDGEVEGEEEDNLGTADSKNRSIAWPSNPSGKRCPMHRHGRVGVQPSERPGLAVRPADPGGLLPLRASLGKGVAPEHDNGKEPPTAQARKCTTTLGATSRGERIET